MPSCDEDHEAACFDVSQEWRRCNEQHLLHPKIKTVCQPQRDVFDRCVADWRAVVGSAVQVKGENPGDPPPQCQSHSCLVEQCLKRTTYDFDKCEAPMSFFKHCVKSFYGKEYVD